MKLQADDGSQLSSKTELPALDGATLKDYDAKGVKGIEITKFNLIRWLHNVV